MICAAFAALGISFAGASSASAYTASYAGASADGAYVFFNTDGSMTPADTDGSHVDVYQRLAGSTKLVSRGQINGDGPFDSYFNGASADGLTVFFGTAEPLVSTDTDGGCGVPAPCPDVYARFGGTTALVSLGQINGNGTAFPGYLANSADGSRVVFATGEQLVEADTDDQADVYVRDAGGTVLATPGTSDSIGGTDTWQGASADATRIFFRTTEQLLAADQDAVYDIYEYSSGALTLISQGSINGNGPHHAELKGMSSDGTRAFFEITEVLENDDVGTGKDVYERSGTTTTLVSRGSGGDGTVAASFVTASSDGSHVLFTTEDPLSATDTACADPGNMVCDDIYDRSAGATTLVTQNDDGVLPASDVTFALISADGTRAAFWSEAQLAAEDTDDDVDVYERAGGETNLISQGSVIDGGGTKDVFLTGAPNRILPDPSTLVMVNSTNDIFTGSEGSVVLVSGANGAGLVYQIGPRVYYDSSQQLTLEDENPGTDVYGFYDGAAHLISLPSAIDDPDPPIDDPDPPVDPPITGTGGDDAIVGTNGDDTILAGGGNDTIDGGGGDDTIIAGPGNDNVTGGGGEDEITGGAGNDTLSGGAGDDTLVGDGANAAPATAGAVAAAAGGKDRLIGGAGKDRLIGGPKPDRLLGGGGRDVLLGGTGADVLIGGGGRDRLQGGPGSDRQRQ